MATPCRPAWSTVARDKLPVARAAEARELARERAAAERAREAASRFQLKHGRVGR